MPTLTVVVVAYNHADGILRTLSAVQEQLEQDDELVVVDNASADDTADVVAEHAPWARLIRSDVNLGYAGGCNVGARGARGQLLLLLNQDVVPAAGAIAAQRAGQQRWDAWQGLVTYTDGVTVNTAGGELHYLGFGWAGGDGGAVAPSQPRVVGFASGSCLMVKRELWERLGGFAESFFMYFEDVDFSLRVRLAGGRVGIEPAAVYRHAYTFRKGASKWERLERNRWATLVRTYPDRVLVPLLPALVALEPALLVYALAQGWAGAKLRAQTAFLRALPQLVRERRAIQEAATVGAPEFVAALRPVLDSAYFGRAASALPVRVVLTAQWHVLRALAGARERDGGS